MGTTERGRRLRGIQGLRKSLEWAVDQKWVTDQTRIKALALLDHIGRTGKPVPDELLGE